MYYNNCTRLVAFSIPALSNSFVSQEPLILRDIRRVSRKYFLLVEILRELIFRNVTAGAMERRERKDPSDNPRQRLPR